MTVEKDQFKAFFKMVLEKLAICGKRGRFRAKHHEIKVVGNAILNSQGTRNFGEISPNLEK